MSLAEGQQKNADLDSAITHLAKAAMFLTPDLTVQTNITTILNYMYEDGVIGERIAIQLLNIMLDGLRHGNWPHYG